MFPAALLICFLDGGSLSIELLVNVGLEELVFGKPRMWFGSSCASLIWSPASVTCESLEHIGSEYTAMMIVRIHPQSAVFGCSREMRSLTSE